MATKGIKNARRDVVYTTLKKEFLRVKDATKENMGENAFAEWKVMRASEIRKQQEVCINSRFGLLFF